jgi:hypothetical protein
MFDESRKVGGLTFDPAKDITPQIAEIVEILLKKLGEVHAGD